MSDITEILNLASNGDKIASEQLTKTLYQELRKLAVARLEREPGQLTMQPTDLVHEVYLRLISGPQTQSWNSKGHFFGAAATAMRRILVEQARRRKSVKHGGNLKRITLNDPAEPDPDKKLLAIDEALQRLEVEDAIASRVVELHQFVGLSYEDIAAAIEISVYQVRQKWQYARAWLKLELTNS